ncbi:MAG TPA: aminotransferase class I/II-fold pyridoxal phosphate-dependent enzyme, partial [Syntrophales bacterium]|nr:aminotransferase class I/II-fold pyridoxal phosphate-dependent enzyme [Syntrophales bacterium]
MIPYGRQSIDEEDIQAVVEVLRSDWLTTGPKVEEFERAFARAVGAKHAVAVSSGTAALHAAMYALGIGPGDEVIVPPMTFAATANCVVFQGGTPVFADVEEETLLIDPKEVERRITPRTRAIIAVDYAGQPCDYDELCRIAKNNNIYLVSDACHALGAKYKGRPVGSLADLTVFSFHPVKHITTGEGGMITTDHPELADRMRIFRNHGITTDHRQREALGSWFYEMVDLGYNYRITDFQCALGLSQLKKLPIWLKRRHEIADEYRKFFSGSIDFEPLIVRDKVYHAYHLYIIRLKSKKK